MSLRTEADIEKHALYIANGMTGLKLLKDFQIESPELKQFLEYLNTTERYSVDSELTHFVGMPTVGALKDFEKAMNKCLLSIKETAKNMHYKKDKKGEHLQYEMDDLVAIMHETGELYTNLLAIYDNIRNLNLW